MILWSYLLLGHPAPASIDNVLVPLPDEREWVATTGDEGREEASATADRRTLVERAVDELDLLSELEGRLADRLQPAGRLRLIPLSPLPRPPRSVRTPAVTLLDHPPRLVSSTAVLRFRIDDGDRVVGNHVVTFRIQVIAEAWSPVRRLLPGEVLQSADVAPREIDLVREPRAVVADPALFSRYEVARAVAPDRLLTWNDLVPRALVRKGEVVDVVGGGGRLTITMKGQATRSGALGESITIRNLESKREFSAEVIDENRVRVRF